ncbi:hypothetical protein TNIN_120461 [Trichonephila inaurata madagascariensis]|uniref:Uncharacterized protein n=1 Tax=Trichonephila inaurata madagascariensis TaxID=2747483 RepID=A0A8X7CL94_9ARAC|nr:hypothetical protein TNIN_120461 [Trichonephila inaurata madagascariensis]
MTNYTLRRFYQVRMPDEIFFPFQLLQLEETTPFITPYRDNHRGGPLRLPGGRKDALRESPKRNNERLNGKRRLYARKENPFHFGFPCGAKLLHLVSRTNKALFYWHEIHLRHANIRSW